MKKQQSGFTLIELVVVIVILGILAATAIPRFVNMSTEATAAARQGVVGGLNSAIAIVHAKWLVQSPQGTTVQLDGAPSAITVNSNGYPNIGATATYKDDASCADLVGNLLGGNTSSYTITFTGGNCTVTGNPTPYATVINLSSTSAS